MKIDWFTVIAQAFNFLVLLWLMKRFLYKPILKAIDEREKRVAGELADADAKKTAADKQKEEYDRKAGEMNDQGTAFLKQARDEAQTEKERLLQEARDAAEELGKKRRDALAGEEATLREEIGRRTGDEVLAVARKVLADLAGTSLEERVVAVFAERLREMNADQKKALIAAMTSGHGPVTVRSALDISPELKIKIEKAIGDGLDPKAKVEFETAPDLISGIELGVNGQKLAWSVADYLSSMGEGYADLLKENGKQT